MKAIGPDAIGTILYDLREITSKNRVEWKKVKHGIYEGYVGTYKVTFKCRGDDYLFFINDDLVLDDPKSAYSSLKNLKWDIDAYILLRNKKYLFDFKKTLMEITDEIEKEEEGETCSSNTPVLFSDELDTLKTVLQIFKSMFDTNWATTKEEIAKIDKILTSDGTFLEPKVELEGYEWSVWVNLVREYKGLKCNLPQLF